VMGWPSASRIARLHRRDSSPTTKCTDRANLVASRLASVTLGANSLMAASSRGGTMISVSILFDYSVMYSSRAPPFLSCNFDLKKQPFRVLRKAHGVNHLVPGIPGVEVMPPLPPVWGIVGRLREVETRPAGSRVTPIVPGGKWSKAARAHGGTSLLG
jgi:hypothetical protein